MLGSTKRALVLSTFAFLFGCDSTRPPPERPALAAEPRVAPSASSASSAAPALVPPGEPRILDWSYDTSVAGPMHVVVVVPGGAAPAARLPVLVALHGRGEAFKGPLRGSRGWVDDYWLLGAMKRLASPPLTPADFQQHADPERLARLNASLSKRPFRGLIVVCPYTPDILAGDRPLSAAEPFARFVVDELLPRVRRETPALDVAAATGIDGVSLGGRASLLVGLGRPEAFGAVASLQAAFDSADAPALVDLARRAREKKPGLRLRLLTSDRDYFLNANRSISSGMTAAGISHQLDVLPGPHDYDFNRGPGSYEMLLFHDRALRGEPYLEDDAKPAKPP